MKRIFMVIAALAIIATGTTIGGFRPAEAEAAKSCQYARVNAVPGAPGGLSGNVSVCKTGTFTFDGFPLYRVDVTHVDTDGAATVYLCTDGGGRNCETRNPSLSTVISTGCSDGPMLEFVISSSKRFKSVVLGSTDFANTLGVGKLGATYVAPPSCPDPPGAVTSATNVCVVYAVDGIFSGGIAVLYPNVFTYWQDTTSGEYLIRFGSGAWSTVDVLFVAFLPEGATCYGPL